MCLCVCVFVCLCVCVFMCLLPHLYKSLLVLFIDPHTRPALWDHCWLLDDPLHLLGEGKIAAKQRRCHNAASWQKWLLDSKYTRWHIFCGGASGWQQQLVTQSASWQLISSLAYLTSTNCEGMGENTEPRLTFHARQGDWHSYFGQWLAIVTIIGNLIPSHELNSSIKYHSISVKAHLKAFILLINGGSFLDLCSG